MYLKLKGTGRRCPRPIPELSTPASPGEAVLIVTYVAGDLGASGAGCARVCARARARARLARARSPHSMSPTHFHGASAPRRHPRLAQPGAGPAPARAPLIEPGAHQSASRLPVSGLLPAPARGASGCHCHCSSRPRAREPASPPRGSARAR